MYHETRYSWIQNVHEEQVEASILTNGLYYVHLKNWIKAGFRQGSKARIFVLKRHFFPNIFEHKKLILI